MIEYVVRFRIGGLAVSFALLGDMLGPKSLANPFWDRSVALVTPGIALLQHAPMWPRKAKA